MEEARLLQQWPQSRPLRKRNAFLDRDKKLPGALCVFQQLPGAMIPTEMPATRRTHPSAETGSALFKGVCHRAAFDQSLNLNSGLSQRRRFSATTTVQSPGLRPPSLQSHAAQASHHPNQ